MDFQKVLKGIAGLSPAEAAAIVQYDGIRCNWWRLAHGISSAQIKARLTEAEMLAHLNRYGDPLPAGHPLRVAHNAQTYGDVTPFISTTAGAVQRDAFGQRNIIFPAFLTALRFATNNFAGRGFVFYAYVTTLGKKATPLVQFGEEVRELHVYRQFLPWHHEGEIVAKITIPSAQIEKAEEYDGPAALAALRAGQMPVPVPPVITNADYAPPADYANVQELF